MMNVQRINEHVCDKVEAHEASVIRLPRIACMSIWPGSSRPYAGYGLYNCVHRAPWPCSLKIFAV